MSLYAISDLHLDLSFEKPMEIFGNNWKNHHIKIKNNWIKKITEEDTILMPGDTSWAMRFEDAKQDLEFLDNLPGKKILIEGNHDYWWSSIAKMKKTYKNLEFIKNSFSFYKDYAICGSRGWLCPNDTEFTACDEKIYKRELGRLKISLNMAVASGFKKIIVMLHYPPTNDKKESSEILELLGNYNVEKFIYGHLHGSKFFDSSIKGYYDDIFYYLVSADYLNFNPIKLSD